MSLDLVAYSRSIYSILDFLGDVGGLYSILLDLGIILVTIQSFVFGSFLEKFLRLNIFKRYSIMMKENNKVSKNRCSGLCLQDKSIRKFKKRAKLRIEKELDIVNFMKKQLKLSIAIESLL